MPSNVEILKQGYEAFGQGDVKTAVENFDPDIVWVEPDAQGWPGRGIHHGVDAVINEVLAVLPEYFEDFKVEAEDWIDGGDTCVVTGRVTGTVKGGSVLDSPFAHVWKFRAGKAVRMQNYEDTARTLEALSGAGRTP